MRRDLPRQSGDDPQRSTRIVLLVAMIAGIGIPLLMQTCFHTPPPRIGCQDLCEAVNTHCAFIDHSPCLGRCEGVDSTPEVVLLEADSGSEPVATQRRESDCRTRCVEQPLDCKAHCGKRAGGRCLAALERLYGCVLLRCGSRHADLWDECREPLTAYETCLRQEPAPSPILDETLRQ